MASLDKTIKIGLWTFLLVLIVNVVLGASCTTPTGKFSVSNGNPPNGVTLHVGSPNSYWNGVNRVNFSVTLSGTFDNNCTYVYLDWIILDPQFNEVEIYPNKPGVYYSGEVPLPEIPGTYYWRNSITPRGLTCKEGTCITSPDVYFSVVGATLPTPPHLDTIYLNSSYPAGTTSIPVRCAGSCPDPNGCDLYFYNNDGNQFAHYSVSNCTGINCFSKTATYGNLSAGTYTVECKIIDTHSQYATIAGTFKINGTTCPSISQNWISPTPGYGAIVQDTTSYFRMSVSSNPSSNVDIIYYFCEDNSNSCAPTLFNFYAAKDLTPTAQTLKDMLYIAPSNVTYVRWYVKYHINSPEGCPDIGPRSNAGNSVSWFKINTSTSGSLTVALVAPSDGANDPVGDIYFAYQINGTNFPKNIQSTLYVDGSPVKMNSFTISGSGVYEYFVVSGLNVGSHSAYVIVTDGTSTVQSNTVNFNIFQGPTVTLISPSDLYKYPNGATSTSSKPLTWSVTSPTPTVDRLYINGVLNQTFPSTSNFIRSTNIPIQGGMVYTWYVNSTDMYGQSSLSDTWSFSIECNSSWSGQYTACQPGGYQTKIYIDTNNCVVPNPPVPSDNGTKIPCVYCMDQWDCNAWSECQPNGYQYCSYSDIVNSGIAPCPNSTPPYILNRTCVFSSSVDKVDFSSNELVDLNDPFNRGILPDIWNGIIAWMSTPFLYWLLWIVAALALFLSAIAFLYWVRNMR